MKVAVLPGDGIGREIIAEAVKVLRALERLGLSLELRKAPVGGAGYDAAGDPLPSASLDENNKGLYEPIHGSAPDIAGRGIANPLATILSAAMMLRYSLNRDALADRVEAAVRRVLAQGFRTGDIHQAGMKRVGTGEMGDAVVAAL